jgi:Mg2+/Co2+ transporter CorB
MTVLLVIFSEILPKSLALFRPEQFALFVAPFARVVVFVFGPISSAANYVVRGILHLFGVNLSSDANMVSAHEEIRGAVEVLHREGSFVKQDRDRVGGLLDLAELEVSDIMIHRTAMKLVNAGDAPDVVVREILQSPYTRMPLYRDEADNIVGVVHAKDLLRALHEVGNDPAQVDIMKVATKPWFVPDTTTLRDQLNAFLRRKAHFAIVVDEYGEVEGLVTLEDIIEEIVGEIADEHDVDIQGVKQEADGSIVVDGGVPIRDLNRALDWNLPDDEATTIAGLVIHEAQMIPEEKQAFTFHGKRFIVMKRNKNRIVKLRIKTAGEPGALA